MQALKKLLQAPFRFLTSAIWEIQSYTFLSSRAIVNLFTRPIYMREVILQMDRIGVGSLTIILLTGFFTGAVLGIQSESALRRYGAVSITGQLVSITLVRELGPVLSALMMAGRIGSGIASELGSMVVSEQINAMRALGTDPTRRLVTPRMIATIIMLPLLTILCNAVGLGGGWVIARYKLLISSSQYWSDAINALEFSDVFGTLLKPLVFGFIISMTGCYVGLRTYGGTEGVGRSTTQAVDSSSILVITAESFSIT
jgi:phospholipid/cholesterol/gamma-HCH transport system permease protein